MNIILVSNNMAKARTLNKWQSMLLLLTLLVVPSLLTLGLILPYEKPLFQEINSAPLAVEPQMSDADYRENLNALAIRLGQIQAHVVRLDALGGRLAKLAGIKDKGNEFDLQATAGQGGPMRLPRNTSEQDIEFRIAALVEVLEQKSDNYVALEAMLLQQALQQNVMPNNNPVDGMYNSSSFGWRVDPFTGKTAFHEGLDFTAIKGTPIYAAASGIVVTAGRNSDYGYMIQLDHGSGIVTRYAHASQLLVKPGQRVTKGQIIARVGSTGRSTGPHLHFEVRINGVAVDPRKFLNSGQG